MTFFGPSGSNWTPRLAKEANLLEFGVDISLGSAWSQSRISFVSFGVYCITIWGAFGVGLVVGLRFAVGGLRLVWVTRSGVNFVFMWVQFRKVRCAFGVGSVVGFAFGLRSV